MIASGSFYLNGGTISGNQAPIGGEVAAYDLFKMAAEQAGFDIQEWSTVYHCPARFEMAGGAITGNRAVLDKEADNGCGGGVYVASNTCSIRGGTISGNLADRQGGGIYVGSTPYTLHMSDTLVTENSATVLGGGIWLCPTGDVVNTVTNGGAVFGNDAAAPDGGMAAGDDLVAVPQEEKAHQVSLADRLLGGGEVAWYVDGGVKSTQPELGNVLGEPDGTPRFDAANPGERQTGIDGCTDGLSLKAVVNDSAARLAASRAQVVVTGNSAPRGGGIGSNGAIVIGTEEEEWRLVVTKAWDHVEESGRKPVTVRLKIGDYALDAVTLSEENGWTAEFTQLPNPDTLGELSITVVEEGNEYQAAYSEVAKDEQSKTLSVTVTNSPAPQPETGDLVIAKTVTGDGGDQSEDFSFQVVLTQPLTGLYGDLSFADGTAQFSLRHGQSVTACGLPAGVGYTVVEQQANENGYTTSSTGEQGTIRKDAVQRADFINHREGQVPPQEEPQQPDHPDSQVPPTGDAAGSASWLLGMTAAGIAAAVILYGKKRTE